MKRVYFIRPIGMDGPIKIGCSMSPTNRRASLQFWSPFPLEIVAEIDGSYGLERQFHARFQHLFEGHEWFRCDPELVAVIEQINAGTFDVSTLPPPKVLHNTVGGVRKPWTPEARLAASYSHRCRWARHRSGFMPPIWPSRRDMNPEVVAKLEAYLAEPHVHGRTTDWEQPKRDEYLKSIGATS